MSIPFPDIPVGGRLKLFKDEWFKISNDKEIRDMVSGMHISLDTVPVQKSIPKPLNMGNQQKQAARDQIATLLEKKAIIPWKFNPSTDFMNTVFLRLKKDKGWRMILDLKIFNVNVSYQRFKIESLKNILDLVTPFCWMGSIDFCDAYLTMAMHPSQFKYLCFEWEGQVLCYVVLPFGLAESPRKFSKLLKPILRLLRTRGILVIIYIDDSWICGRTFNICFSHIQTAARIFTRYGFIPHREKSVLIPTQIIEVLGHIINSRTMTVYLSDKKTSSTVNIVHDILRKDHFTVRFLAKVIGKLVSCFIVVPLGRGHYRSLERIKVATLRKNHGNFQAKCSLTAEARTDLYWWLHVLPTTAAPIHRGNPSLEIWTDASLEGWGCFFDSFRIQGRFTVQEQELSINTRELLAIKYGIRSFLDRIAGSFLLVRSDNTTAIANVSHMGCMKSVLRDAIAQDIWQLASDFHFWILTAHVCGVDNIESDTLSRVFNDQGEWALVPGTFHAICAWFGLPSVDLFATRVKAKLPCYVSWNPDPYCFEIDAFSIPWNFPLSYIFPPFILASRCLFKISQEHTRAVVILPFWPNQPWFPKMLQMLIAHPLIFHKSNNLYLPWSPEKQHPLDLFLLAVKLSGNLEEQLEFQRTLPTSSPTTCPTVLTKNIADTSSNGWAFVLSDRLISVHRLWLC